MWNEFLNKTEDFGLCNNWGHELHCIYDVVTDKLIGISYFAFLNSEPNSYELMVLFDWFNQMLRLVNHTNSGASKMRNCVRPIDGCGQPRPQLKSMLEGLLTFVALRPRHPPFHNPFIAFGRAREWRVGPD